MKSSALRLGSAAALVCCLLPLLPAGRSPGAEPAAGPPVVFVVRVFEPSPGAPAGAVARAESGVLRLATHDGQAWRFADLVSSGPPPGAPGVPLDVADPDVSYDGMRIVFAGYLGSERAWRIFEVKADGTGLRQVTGSTRAADLSRYGEAATRFESYDDADPCYLPDGRICFVSTRYPGFSPGRRLQATNLYVVGSDGGGLRRITTERFGADTPAVDPSTGKIVYSRWWLTARETPPPSGGPSPNRPPVYYGPTTNPNNFSSTVLRGIADDAFPGVNVWSLASIHPDGTGLAMHAGFGLNRELTMAYRPSFFESGELLAQFITESPVLAEPGRNGLRRLGSPGTGDLPVALGGPQAFDGSATLQDPDLGAPIRPRTEPAFLYASSQPYADGRILVTGTPVSGSPRYDVYIQEPAPGKSPVRLFGSTGEQDLDAVMLAPRELPPVIPDAAPPLTREEAPRTVEEAVAQGGTFTFVVENIFANGPVDLRIAGAPPVGRDMTIELYMNPQREGTTRPDPPILVAARPIGPDGKVEVELPAGVPLFEVLRRPDGRIALGRDGQAFHVGGMNFGVPGKTARCVGCHAGHSMLPVPAEGDPEAAWTNIAPSAFVTASSVRGVDDFSGGGFTFPPAVLVDRLRDPLGSEWAAGAKAVRTGEATVRLRWTRPVVAREIVVHGTAAVQGRLGDRSQVIHAFTVATYLGAGLEPVATVHVKAAVKPEGTSAPLDPALPFDALEITIRTADVSGLFEGQSAPALSEVEVIGKAAGEAPATYVIRRGDVDCDGRVNVTDPIALLASLFQGAGPLCCDASADPNEDSRINLTDAVFLMAYLFQGGEPLSLRCERATGGPLECEQETCG